MDKVSKIMRMEMCIMVNGEMVKEKVGEHKPLKMEISIQENGKMINSMGKVN